jgi:hypothetical protein
MDKEAKRTSLVGEGATHRERTLYCILSKFFSKTLPASRSITHKRVAAENIGFLHHSIDLDTRIEREDLSSTGFVLGIVTGTDDRAQKLSRLFVRVKLLITIPGFLYLEKYLNSCLND